MTIDILQHELDNKRPHWLSPAGKGISKGALTDGRRKAIRAKHRAAYWAARAAEGLRLPHNRVWQTFN